MPNRKYEELQKKQRLYQEQLDAENFGVWNKSQLKSRLRAINKQITRMDEIPENFVIRTEEDARDFALLISEDKDARTKIKSAEIPTPNQWGETIHLKKGYWDGKFNISLESGVEDIFGRGYRSDVSIQTRKNGSGYGADEFVEYYKLHLAGNNTHLQNVMIEGSATIDAEFLISKYIAFGEEYSEEKLRQLILEKVYSELYDKLFNKNRISKMKTDKTSIKIDFIEKVKVETETNSWGGERETVENNEIDAWRIDAPLISPDRPVVPKEEEREVA